MSDSTHTPNGEPSAKGFARFEAARNLGHGYYVCAVEDNDAWGLLIRSRDGAEVRFETEDGERVRWLLTNTSAPGKHGLHELDLELLVNGFARTTPWVWHPNHSWWAWIDGADLAETLSCESEAA